MNPALLDRIVETARRLDRPLDVERGDGRIHARLDLPERRHDRILERFYAEGREKGWDLAALDAYRNTLTVSVTQITSGGLTTATTAYSANDQVGTQFTVTGMAVSTGLGGVLTDIMLNDESAIIGQYRFWVTKSTVTPAADNAAFSLSDGDSEVQISSGPFASGGVSSGVNNFTVSWNGAVTYLCAATSLFVNLQTLAAHTFFGATTSLKLQLSTVEIS